jgi:uncharacterized membrane protein YfcA
MLTAWFHATQHEAHGTSLAVVGATALASLVIYGSHSNVDWLTAIIVGASSVFAARLGARLATRTSSRNLTLGFAIFLLLVAVRLMLKLPTAPLVALPHGLAAVALDLALGVAVGVLAGYMGVGGGIIAVPAFTLLLGMPQQIAQGTSLAVILVTAPVGAIEHARHGNMLRRIVGWLALGAAAGAAGASALVQKAPGDVLRRGFALFLLANVGLTFLRARRRGRGPGAPAGSEVSRGVSSH